MPLHKYGLSELIRVIHVTPGDGPNRAGPDLGSTHAGGKDDGSLHQLPQTTIAIRGLVISKEGPYASPMAAGPGEYHGEYHGEIMGSIMGI